MRDYYRLDGYEVKTMTFEERLRDNVSVSTPIARSEVGGIIISTVFLTIDQGANWNLDRDAPPTVYHPYVFETAIINGCESFGIKARFRTRAEAEKGHLRAVQLAKKSAIEMCRLGSVRRLKRAYYNDLECVRDWYNNHYHKTKYSIRKGGSENLEVKNLL